MQVALISLGNIGDLRGVDHPDHGPMWSVPDFVNVMNEKGLTNSYGRTTWCRMISGEHKNELATSCSNLIIPGSQGRPTPCANILGLQRILSLLPGDIARKYRDEVQKIFNQVLTGDKSLITVIEENAKTSHPIQELVRDATKRKHGELAVQEDPEDRKRRYKLMDAEIGKIEAETRKMNEETKKMAEETLTLRRENIVALQKEYTGMCVGEKIDDRARLLFKDNMMNCVGISTTDDPNATPMTISTYAAELGIRITGEQAKEAGVIMAKRYKDKYNIKPSKHGQLCDGAVRNVNSYTRTDADMLLECIRDVAGTK